MEYHLYPPFLIVPEEHNFPDVWEAFCCKMLKLNGDADNIDRRTPPEQGIDLYNPTTKTAYQCKSVESGKGGDFDVRKALASLKAAQQARGQPAWEQYAICTNVNLTGIAERKLRVALSDIILLPASFWHGLCEKYPQQVERNFKQLSSQSLTSVNIQMPSYDAELESEDCQNIFRLFAAEEGVPISVGYVCQELRITNAKARHYINLLTKAGLIEESSAEMSDDYYVLTDDGNSYAFKKGYVQ